jgi:FAD/FMN-containing dehydrogenase
MELTPETIAMMHKIKEAFDPTGILNPGKIF